MDVNHQHLRSLAASLPALPGVYQFHNQEGDILYVGKAKSLRSRVSSYFRNTGLPPKVTAMVRKIFDIRYTVVDSESDALLLENNLIKKYQPRYNILLRDDKSYPWICIPAEPFPRVYAMRNPVADGSRYFGPYTAVSSMKALLELIRQLFPVRTCTLNLSDSQILQGKYKVCLEYHLGNCKAPCVGLQTREEYDRNIEQIVHILEGHTAQVLNYLKSEMSALASGYKFEQAQGIKKKLQLLEKFHSRSLVVNPSVSDVDVYSYADDPESAYVHYLRIVSGAVVQAHALQMVKRLEEQPGDLLAYAIVEIRERCRSNSQRILVPFLPSLSLPGVRISVPRIGDNKKLLELSEKNVWMFRADRRKQTEKTDPERHSRRILETLQADLNLPEMPVYMECFDNSNIQGTHPVSSCVVFRNARPSRKEYRHFNVRTVEGPSDFDTMREVIHRRYQGLLSEGAPLPQLIVVDGGKPQLTAALQSLQALGLEGRIPVIGIAKKLEEIFIPHDPLPLYLNKKSESLKLIQAMRDEAHRFGITHHRNRRSRSMTHSQLSDIPGIGPRTMETLLAELGSVAQIRAAGADQLTALVGKSRADRILRFFGAQGSGLGEDGGA